MNGYKETIKQLENDKTVLQHYYLLNISNSQKILNNFYNWNIIKNMEI